MFKGLSKRVREQPFPPRASLPGRGGAQEVMVWEQGGRVGEERGVGAVARSRQVSWAIQGPGLLLSEMALNSGFRLRPPKHRFVHWAESGFGVAQHELPTG